MTHYGKVSAVDDFLEAVVALSVQGDDGATEGVDFIIDTGYTGEMTLPQEIIDRLNLRTVDYDGYETTPTVILADGAILPVAVYVTGVWWHDRLRIVEVDSIGSNPLIGMTLLQGSNLRVDAIPGGLVTITELSDTFC